MSVRIIVDSATDLPPYLKGKLDTVHMTIHFGEEEYLDGVTITHQEFYRKLVEGTALPTTSQAAPAVFEAMFRKVTEAGDTAVVITVSSLLSGTYQSAVIATEEFENKVFVVDSRNVAIGAGILAELAVKLAEEGKSAGEIAAALEREREKVRLVAVVDTLEYLKRGGRVSKTVAFAGNLLSIKPVIGVSEGQIKMLGKARGNRQGNQMMLKQVEESGGMDVDKPILLGYTGTEDTMLRKFMEESADYWGAFGREIPSTIVGSVVGTHVGPDAIAVAWFAK